MKAMRCYLLRVLLILAEILLLFSFGYSQTKPLPVVVSFRKSFLGGSYVLQVSDTSNSPLKILVDARGKVATFFVPAGGMEEIGWAQGFRFDSNDIFFIWAEGYDTLKHVMPGGELSPIRFGFSKNGKLTINLSQSFLQNRLSKSLELPLKKKFPRVIDIEINEFPQIILRDRSDRIFAG